MTRTLLGASIFGLTLLAIMVRPYRIPEAVAAALGGLAMLAAGIVRPGDAAGVLLGQLNVYGFFLGLMTISAIADQAGVFTVLAGLAGRWAGGSSRRLLVATFAVGSVITAFLSNDATALILTPAVFALVTRLHPGHRPPPPPEHERRISEAEEAAAAAALEEAHAEAERAGFRPHVHSERGRPEQVVIATAEQLGCQLIVIRGSEGAAGTPRLGPGSIGHTARFVLDHAPCDVLLVRASEP